MSVPVARRSDEDADYGKLLDLYAVDVEMFRENRLRVAAKVREEAPPGSVIVLQGGESTTLYSSDSEPLFRQESNFAYLFGVKEPDVFGAIHVDTGKSVLFFPKLPERYAIAMGEIRNTESFKAEYGVDEVHFLPDMLNYLLDMDPKVMYVGHGLNADSGKYMEVPKFEGIEQFRVDNGLLYNVLVECRVIKTERELALLRHINKISSQAHCWTMNQAQPGMREFQLESLFQHWGYFRGGCRHQSYTNICACGSSGSILHYGHAGAPNDEVVEDGDMALLDMGAEYKEYSSDITCSFPVNGKFTDDQKLIYETVLASQFAVMRAMKPGVSYIDMHTLSYRVILENLKKGGLLRGEVEDMMKANLGATFMPHGLGHFMGVDTHDVGGRPKGHQVQTRDGYKSLRNCRVLEVGQVLTVEPGVYFNDFAIESALANPNQACFFNTEMLARFRGFGGCRLEDDVIVTETGIENMTHCPRTVADVEDVMAGRKDATSKFTTYMD
uniref:Xaa-Pro dipeptidase n=1 Tax=Mucochytrium quahogii TaxID=96639 RepID=A0A7S2SQ72_9STRA|mmetsp:Transcript_9684/g.15902  ORF Transcript_9684/g.15902 Transcript_9684/m.15902 type:complete len:499 (-) Transcript_9684:78-1574(-)|eukprot:CAMPEP_0203751882 /NCGR_PEP_ID=MMETSP0098-20131031/5869_1 /ASSEMBLY_ACC=CAM_ASM_000208 /TAXON_ID=96639 /ORGANISM=" , Strain NY0313808BC1" /LENGTH=498 /DNA_ID=CAMNT_0050641789 /DNA_START=32 /DNA_END=1528 /DNA_ORIENTATION=+